jgi:hypothetical protein
MILEYKMNIGTDGCMFPPPFVQRCGYLYNSIDHTYIGFTDDNVKFYIPETVHILTLEQVIARSLEINNVTPYKKSQSSDSLSDLVPMTEEEIKNMVTSIIDHISN